MLLNTTHTNKENNKLIDDIVGKPFSLLQSIKMRGVGSKRMIVDEVSPNMASILNTVSDTNYGNIELRPIGILIHINKGLQNFTWAIPYYQLVVYKINGSSIHSNGKFIHFRNNKTFKENKKFFDKLMNEKIKYDQQFNFSPL
ncbi:hypothetical protein [Olleya marilimosa]|uniref:Arginyl-tRNA synthetase n=1 Tax=Olleya marilimosa TaxID=272164 RepID=A0ABR8LUX1_9FLAO|nr:hypothetical protein [Olleya marilimosa]MBD3862290.1 hypothetical protein [Olleya marilimosa]MBD3889785.1 hypothetical protein [Olleya marilimosa]